MAEAENAPAEEENPVFTTTTGPVRVITAASVRWP